MLKNQTVQEIKIVIDNLDKSKIFLVKRVFLLDKETFECRPVSQVSGKISHDLCMRLLEQAGGQIYEDEHNTVFFI